MVNEHDSFKYKANSRVKHRNHPDKIGTVWSQHTKIADGKIIRSYWVRFSDGSVDNNCTEDDLTPA